ncbi:mycothiol system anti-sigma-R factor [Agrococcus sediminis]|uniref:Mycothiol system anti-sigma-R factor n=1 Tax=Agrococcus sediminis TaxID=2599924 RepID=A0A5M8QAL8_9MICO|nr:MULTISPECIES: zf-HC2 domain-containing protein [Agrococcus]KAA6433027.1 mycothiol system anti-sigma-R factor [Agrococcus sediminis]RWR25860.1 mycothiol system anti-sigma-R factor [Agrococcus lahaulensis]UOW00865.1 zf-HC2 domain-containing protein [Agrococcus sp. SCSIO52902]
MSETPQATKDCTEARAALEEYLHHELCAEDAADVRAHLAECEECSAEHHVGEMLTAALQGACKDRAPEELRAKLLESLRAAKASHA